MRLSRPTLLAAALLAVWFGLDFVGVEHLVDREPLVSLAGGMLLLMALFLAGGALKVSRLAAAYVAALLVWSGLQIETHWSTYLTPASETKLRWYARAFGGHWRILPEAAGHTVPDAYHTILAALLVVNLALAVRDALAR